MEDFNPKVGDIAHFKPRKIVGVEYHENKEDCWVIKFENCSNNRRYVSTGKYYYTEIEDALDIERLEKPIIANTEFIVSNNEQAHDYLIMAIAIITEENERLKKQNDDLMNRKCEFCSHYQAYDSYCKSRSLLRAKDDLCKDFEKMKR